MIRLACMYPGQSKKSGRRYFRGKSRDGSTFWLIENDRTPGMWELKFDPLHDAAAPTAATLIGAAQGARPSLDHQDHNPMHSTDERQ